MKRAADCFACLRLIISIYSGLEFGGVWSGQWINSILFHFWQKISRLQSQKQAHKHNYPQTWSWSVHPLEETR